MGDTQRPEKQKELSVVVHFTLMKNIELIPIVFYLRPYNATLLTTDRLLLMLV